MSKTHSYLHRLFAIACALWFSGFVTHPLFAQTRGVTAKDCVEIRYITGVWMNPQGTRVAYLVKAPDLSENRNDFRLYVRATKDEAVGSGTLIYEGGEPTDVSWLRDGIHLAMLVTDHDRRSVATINSDTRELQITLTLDRAIDEFSLNEDGSVIAYLVSGAASVKSATATRSPEEIAEGYRVEFGSTQEDSLWTSSLFVRRRNSKGVWEEAQQLSIEDPLTHQNSNHISTPSGLTLSPNGKLLSLLLWSDSALDDWKDSPYVQDSLKSGPLNKILVIQNLETGQTKLGFKQTMPDSVPLWSRDSRSFLMNAHSPVGSVWEREDTAAHRTSPLDANLFWVDVESGKIEEIFRLVPSHHQGPLLWKDDGDVVLQVSDDDIARYHREGVSWKEVSRITLPHQSRDWFRWSTSDGTKVYGIHETMTTPDELFSYKPGDPEITRLTDLNPQVRQLRFADVKNISWSTKDGLDVGGLLFLPPDYDPKVRYPLVIQTKGDQGWFTCDSGFTHDPSFAPQPIASAGIMYLIRTSKTGFNLGDELKRRPKGYPGGISEAVQQMEIWDSAVKYLDQQGMIDPLKVGIIGFSRTGWHVEFDLIYAETKYAAATAADNTEYSLTEYWLAPSGAADEESMYGGPPFGPALQNWLKYSTSLNVDKIHTPLLLEEMGYGVHEDIPAKLPFYLAVRYDMAQGLGRLGKPFELYYYPDEGHTPDNPKARLASLARNVDWYRFWLQDYQDPDPAKVDQYVHWRQLRQMQQHQQPLGSSK